MVSSDKAINQLQVLDDGLRQALERILFCSATERSWLQASFNIPPLFMIMLILTPYILVSSLVPSCKLFLIQTWVLVFALSNIGRAFPFYSSHLCSCGSTLGDIFWAMIRALSIFITMMLLPVSC